MFPYGLPAWASSALALGVSLLTVALALVGTHIAWRQWRTSAIELQHKQDDARIRVYRAAMALPASIQAEGCVTGKALQTFLEGTSDATFYFKANLVEYLSDLRAKAIRAMQIADKLRYENLDLNAREKMVTEEAESIKWFMSQFDVLRERFRPYLQIHYGVRGGKRG